MDMTKSGEVLFGWGEEILEYPKLACARISTKHKMPRDAALVCLEFYKWDEVALSADLEALGVTAVCDQTGFAKQHDMGEGFRRCEICGEETMGTESFGCNHMCCGPCLDKHCQQKVKDGERVLCPAPNCNTVAPKTMVKGHLDVALSFELETATLGRMVASKPTMTWCARRLCCCLITHNNWPKDKYFTCPICKAKLKLKDDGNCEFYFDYVVTPSLDRKRPWCNI